jgi:cytochrome c-type biogenesis protein CcmF
LDYLKSANQLDSLVSRESSFLFNNLLLLAACFSVLWGTLFPVISEAVQGVKISVGAPFFNKVNIPIGLVLLFLTGVGPLFAWRKTSLSSLQKNFMIPGVIGLAVGAVLFAFGVREFYPQVSLILCTFVGITVVMEFYRGARVIAQKAGRSILASAVTLTRRNTRRYGGYIVHFGMVLVFVGITGTAFNEQHEQEMLPGDRLAIGRYSLHLRDLTGEDNPNYAVQYAMLDLYRGDQMLGTLRPERRFYKASRQPTTEVAIRMRLNEDLYVVFSGLTQQQEGQQQHAVISAHLNPLVNWIWLGGLVLVIGTLIALMPSQPGAGTSPRVVRAAPVATDAGLKEGDEILAKTTS